MSAAQVTHHTNFKHGEGHSNKSVEYRTWSGMKERCYSERNHNFPRYGGRGIGVCERWRYDYLAFLTDMGRRPENQTLDRIDNDGDYSPSNCRWASRRAQQANRRNTVFVEFAGERILATRLAEEVGVERNAIYLYLKVKAYLENHYGN